MNTLIPRITVPDNVDSTTVIAALTLYARQTLAAAEMERQGDQHAFAVYLEDARRATDLAERLVHVGLSMVKRLDIPSDEEISRELDAMTDDKTDEGDEKWCD